MIDYKGEALSLLRIVVGAAMLVKGLFLLPHINDLYGQYGYLQAPLMEAVNGGNLASWSIRLGISPMQYSILLHAFFATHLFAAFGFMVGFQTKIANVALWLTQAGLFHLAWVSAYGIDSYCLNLCFMMLFLPVNRYWSLDAKMYTLPVPQAWVSLVGLRCLQVYLLITYVDAGFSKSLGEDWWTGQAIWDVLHLPEFNHINFFWLSEYTWIAKALALGTLFIETFYIVGVWIPRIGKLWALSIISMHVVIAFLIGLTLFGLSLALINASLFLYPDMRRLAERYLLSEKRSKKSTLDAPAMA